MRWTWPRVVFSQVGLAFLTFLPVQSHELLKEGLRLLQEEKYSEALLAFDRFKQSAPRDARPYFYSALVLADAHHPSDALAELKQALQLDPNRPEYHLVYAEILSGTGEISGLVEALAVFEQDAFLKQLNPEQLWRLADLWYRVERFEDASRVLSRYAEERPQDSRLHLRRGQMDLVRGRFDAAVEAFTLALEAPGQGRAAAHYSLGVALFMKNEPEGARKALLKAVEEQPDNPEYVDQLATLLLALGEFESALGHLKRVEAEGTRFPRIYDNLGKACRSLGRLHEAREYFGKFQRVQAERQQEKTRKERTQIVLKQARELLDSGRLAEARLKFQEALDLDPNSWLAHSYLAKIYMSSGSGFQAYDHLTRMEEIDPDAFEGKYLMALFLYERSRIREALSYGEEAKKLRPGYAELRNLLGNIYRALGMREKALDEYQAALNLEPDRSDFRLNYESLIGVR